MATIIGEELKKWKESLKTCNLNPYDITVINIILENYDELNEAGGTAGAKRIVKFAELVSLKDEKCDSALNDVSIEDDQEKNIIKRIKSLEVNSFRGFATKRSFDLDNPEYKYTFDEFGEYLLYIFIRHAYNNFYQAKESGYFDIDDKTLENYSGEPLFASSSLDIRDEIYLRELFNRFFDEVQEDEPEIFENMDKDEQVDDLIRAASIFAFMGFENSDESFIFWDDDFLFYDEPRGPELILDDKSILGFVTGNDECEPVSGSLKKKIDSSVL